ncbi:MAG: polyprenyl synthetase family protein [Gemmataceae bacterium]
MGLTVTPQGDVQTCLQERRTRVENWLGDYLKPREGCPAALLEAIRYSLLAPGKRLRPILAMFAAEAGGVSIERALPAAAAVEMVHVYSLIHDDLPAMDDDDLRRGQPTCHKKFGEALAILAGDALLTLAFQVLAEQYPPATSAGCCFELARAAGACGMVGGQVDDLAMEKLPASSRQPEDAEQLLERLHARKTGALFRASLRLGLWAAQGENAGGPDRELLDRLDVFGRCFGLAFQISDDLLDVEGHADDTGKRVNKDAARGKLTYPELWGIDESRRRAAELCQKACDSVAPLGQAGSYLAALAPLLVHRKS